MGSVGKALTGYLEYVYPSRHTVGLVSGNKEDRNHPGPLVRTNISANIETAKYLVGRQQGAVEHKRRWRPFVFSPTMSENHDRD